jgi:two-component system response regulator YesN
MHSTDPLIQAFSPERFRSLSEVFAGHFDLVLQVIDLRGNELETHTSGGACPPFCAMIRRSASGRSRCRQDRLRWLRMAFKTGQPHTNFCHAGVLISCIPIMNHNQPLGGLLVGRCLSEPFSETTEQDLSRRLVGLRLVKRDLFAAARALPVCSARRFHEAVEFLFILLYETTRLDPRVIEWRRQQTLQQAQIGEVIQQRKADGFSEKYPFQSEQELLAKVRIGDKTGAREILNSILGSIVFRNPGQINILKVRLVELLSILSRSASEAGVDPDLLLEKNVGYISKVVSLDTQEDICIWISLALNDFIDSVYELQKPLRDDRLRPAVEFIQKHYREKITLEEIARAAHLSVSRLCHLFRERMRLTIFDYLTDLRISRARSLLISTDRTCLEICYDSGFNNLSYFNRTFKQHTGMSPTQFRRQNHR